MGSTDQDAEICAMLAAKNPGKSLQFCESWHEKGKVLVAFVAGEGVFREVVYSRPPSGRGLAVLQGGRTVHRALLEDGQSHLTLPLFGTELGLQINLSSPTITIDGRRAGKMWHKVIRQQTTCCHDSEIPNHLGCVYPIGDLIYQIGDIFY